MSLSGAQVIWGNTGSRASSENTAPGSLAGLQTGVCGHLWPVDMICAHLKQFALNVLTELSRPLACSMWISGF